jgi:hypothetical protein
MKGWQNNWKKHRNNQQIKWRKHFMKKAKRLQDDQLLDVHLFNVGVDWYGPIIEYFDNDVPKEERS